MRSMLSLLLAELGGNYRYVKLIIFFSTLQPIDQFLENNTLFWTQILLFLYPIPD